MDTLTRPFQMETDLAGDPGMSNAVHYTQGLGEETGSARVHMLLLAQLLYSNYF